MKELYLKYDKENFWKNYWIEFQVDPPRFVQTDMYPINMTLKYVKKEHKVLECGFGGGRVVRHLGANGYDIYGIEYDKNIVERLLQISPELKIEQGSILKLPYEDNFFDISLSFGVIGTLHNNMTNGLLELKRVTKRDGLILVSVANSNLSRKIQRLLNFIARRGKYEFYTWLDSVSGWKAYFKSCDLDVIDHLPVVSRYNIFYWTKFCRSLKESNLNKARVDESEFKLNPFGNFFWLIHKYIFNYQFSAGVTFVLKK